jgi:EAL domain-containing protein (putative c-di-GMP-specific phosphodiesterase class I)
MLPGTNAAGAELTARKVIESMSRAVVFEGEPLSVEVNIGIVSVPEHGSNPDELLQRAERALRVAQQRGSGIAIFSSGYDRDDRYRLLSISELREGVERGEFLLDYQPIVHLQSERVIGVEALARWNHPRRGRLLPAEFIELAETTWLIEPLTMLLLDRAIVEWVQSERLARAPVAVNLSSKSLRDPHLPEVIGDLLRLHNAPPSALTLEVMDDALVLDTPKAIASLTRLHAMGIGLAIDDVNLEFSSASYLRRLPIDRLKIGRACVSRTAYDDTSLRSLVELAHRREVVVVAEGVEAAETQERLRTCGCDAAQGHFIAAPASVSEMRRWLARTNAEHFGGAGS